MAPSAQADTQTSIGGTVKVRKGVDLEKVEVWAMGLYSKALPVASASVAPDGNYTISGLQAGEYRVFFYSGDYNAWWPEEIWGGSDFDTSVPVLVNEGQQRTGIDLDMSGGRIQGQVAMPFYVDYRTVHVEALDPSGAVVASEFPDASGLYDLRGLPTGDYRVRVSGGVLTSWYGGGASFSAATPISISGEQDVQKADVTGDAGASISGWVNPALPSSNDGWHRVSVRDLAGKVIQDISVRSGSYTLSGLEPGQYKLALDMTDGLNGYEARASYQGQYYNGVTEDQGFQNAQTISLAAHEEKTRFDFSGEVGGTITGVLRDVEGHELPLAVVEAYTRDGSFISRKAITDTKGNFSITGLTTGSYRLRGNTTNVRLAGPTYSGNVAEQSEAKEIAVTSGAQTDVGTVTYWSPKRFADVFEGQQFDHEISWTASTGISTGWPDATFRPYLPVNRDAMAAFLYRLAGQPTFTPPAVSPFADVPTTSQFYKEIAWLASAKISGGWPDKTFRPLEPVNRDAMAAFLYRFSKIAGYIPPATSPFVDVPATGQFYKEIAWLASTEISTGWPDKTFRPVTPVNRDAMAAFMYRFNVLDK
ncbi:S-layer homology domain-containing protein [Paenarthrobacter sp. AR 02]|nr:S-layer homology domain-containing protein [Paenarthrobacter sp. AR 02]